MLKIDLESGRPTGGLHPAIFAKSFFEPLLNMPEIAPTYDVRSLIESALVVAPLPPRFFLTRFLNFRYRDMILVEARKQAELLFENTKVMLEHKKRH